MNTPKIFILIHGAWHASWCWQEIAKLLAVKGHTVITPDLPGHAQYHNANSPIKFSDYVTAVTEIVRQQQERVILVGHSMAGLIISQVAELVPNHICELIFLGAYVTRSKQSLFSIAEQSASKGLSPYLSIDEQQQKIFLKKGPALKNIFFNYCDQAIADDLMAKLQPQPLQPFFEEVTLGNNFKQVAKRSLVCKYDLVLLPSDQLRMSQAVTDNIQYIDADHAAYSSAVVEIANALT